MGQKKSKEQSAGPILERVEAERDIWCLVVRDAVTGEARNAFLDYCSHKSIPLGPKVALTKKGQIRCPHHDVCFDCASGVVTDDKGKKMPVGLVPVALQKATAEVDGTNATITTDTKNDDLTLTITPEHRAYLSKHLQKLDKSRGSTKRRKEQNHAGDINKTND